MKTRTLGVLTGTIIAGALSAAALAIAPAQAANAAPPAAPDTPLQALPYSPGLDASAMDTSVNACSDLYHFACGGWQKRNPIPADQSSWDVYGKLYVDNQRYLWGILEDAAKPFGTRTPVQTKIGDYFAACMNVDAIERAGAQPIRPDLDAIDALADKHLIAALVGRLHVHMQTGASCSAQESSRTRKMQARSSQT